MLKLNQSGSMNPLLIPLILAVLAFIGTSVTTYMYYANYVDQRDNVDKKIASAVELAEEQQREKLELEFDEKEKLPNRSYTAPSIYGSVKLTFPKTWSGFVAETGSQLDYYGHPNYVPSKGVNYALRMNISDKQFATEVKSYESKVKNGELRASSITVAEITGTRLDGLLKKEQDGILVLFPLRDKVLKVWTENKDFKADFENILKTLTFEP